MVNCSGHAHPTELYKYWCHLLSNQSVVLYLRSPFNFVESQRNENIGPYQFAPLTCNLAYTRSIKEDFGFQDPFRAFSESKKWLGTVCLKLGNKIKKKKQQKPEIPEGSYPPINWRKKYKSGCFQAKQSPEIGYFGWCLIWRSIRQKKWRLSSESVGEDIIFWLCLLTLHSAVLL